MAQLFMEIHAGAAQIGGPNLYAQGETLSASRGDRYFGENREIFQPLVVPCRYRLMSRRGAAPAKPAWHVVGPRIAAIGKAAILVTDQRDKKVEIVKELASAHDLPQAFGFH